MLSTTGTTMFMFRTGGETLNRLTEAGHPGGMAIKETCDWNMAPPSGQTMQLAIKLTGHSQLTTNSVRFDDTGREQMISIK